ncbi:hypothetical protein F5Y06DRAFT_257119 [Hypoxylon sp. FL0890]|nr:hypothetical protein F5Y06DRAFT_257119 [Hypoxylon sp. FL0890]
MLCRISLSSTSRSRFTRAAQNIDADHPAQARLIRLILWARELGVLRRRTQGGQSQAAVSNNGHIWSDLPFFVPDVQHTWKAVMEKPSPPSHRYNLAAGIARLAGVRVCSDAFAQCRLEVMKVAFEIPRGPLKFVSLLPFDIVKVWLRYAGDQLLRLSLTGLPADGAWAFNAWTVDSDGQPVGPLARQAGITEGGFSRDRFVFWKRRLATLKMESEDEIAVVSQCASMIHGIWYDYFRPSKK